MSGKVALVNNLSSEVRLLKGIPVKPETPENKNNQLLPKVLTLALSVDPSLSKKMYLREM